MSRTPGIYGEGPGQWRIVVSTGKRLSSGGYKRVVRIVEGTKEDAKSRRAEILADLSRSAYVPPAKESLGSYLSTWIERVKPPHGEIKVSTWKSYETHVRVHLLADPIAERRLSVPTCRYSVR